LFTVMAVLVWSLFGTFASFPISLPPRSPLFPYTTLFRSLRGQVRRLAMHGNEDLRARPLVHLDKFAAARVAGDMHQGVAVSDDRSEEHTSELQSRENLVCRLLLEKKNRVKGMR